MIILIIILFYLVIGFVIFLSMTGAKKMDGDAEDFFITTFLWPILVCSLIYELFFKDDL